MIGPYTEILTLVLSFLVKGDINNREKLQQGFHDHYNHIRSIVPTSQLLEFTPRDGWKPLCQFLEKPVPREPYPRLNEGPYTSDRHWRLIWIRLAIVLKAKAPYWGSCLVLIGAVYWAWRKMQV